MARKRSAVQKEEDTNVEKIASVYADPSAPGGFGGLNALYNEVKQRFPGIGKKDVLHFLEGNRTYTLFKPRKNKFERSRTIPLGYMTSKLL
jgi:hypothetical protein